MEFEDLESDLSQNNEFDNAKQILFEKLRQSHIKSYNNSVMDESIVHSVRDRDIRHSEIYNCDINSFQMTNINNLNNEVETQIDGID